MALTDQQILAYLSIKGVGNKTVFRLADYAKKNNLDLASPQEMLALFNDLLKKKIISRCKIEDTNAIIDGMNLAQRLVQNSAEMGIKYTTYFSEDYPKKLRYITDAKGECDAPLILWYKGDLSIADMPSVAVIGTREPTPEGIAAGHYIAKTFAEAGFNIVSGLAYGCDRSGHEGALMAKNGKTTAFLAHGLDTVYPPEHKELAAQIVARGGLLMSEYPIGQRGMASFFIARDRLQSGLSDACIAIQTGRSGGTLHACRATVANRKTLYAVKYNDEVMQQFKVQGNTMLIEEGISPEDKLTVKQKALPLVSAELPQIIESLLNKGEKAEMPLTQNEGEQLSLF